MPRLPDAASLGARPVPRPDLSIVRPADRSAQSRAIEDLGRTVSRAGEVFQRQNDEAELFEFRNKLNDYEAQNIYDPEKGAMSKKGKDALNLAETVPQDFDRAVGQLQNGLTNNATRRAAAGLIQARRASIGEWASRYAGQQREAYLTGQTEATIASSRNRAAMLSNDPSVVAGELAIQKTLTANFLRDRGKSEEEIGQAVQGVEAQTHAAILDSMLASDKADQALSYYDTVKGRMGDLAPKYAQAVQQAGYAQKAQTVTADLMKQGLSESRGLQYIRENYSGVEEEKFKQEWIQTFNEDRAARQQTQAEADDRGWQYLSETGKLPPSGVLDSMSGSARYSIQKTHEQQMTGVTSRTDPDTYMKLADLAARDPEKFAAYDLRNDFPNLSQSDQQHFIDLRAKAGKPEEIPDLLTFEQQKSEARRALGMGSGDADKARVSQFDAAINNAIRSEELVRGKKLGYDDRQKLINHMLAKGAVEVDWGRDKSTRLYQVRPEDEGRFYVPLDDADSLDDSDLRRLRLGSSGDREAVSAALKRAGIANPTENDIQQALYQRLRKQNGR